MHPATMSRMRRKQSVCFTQPAILIALLLFLLLGSARSQQNQNPDFSAQIDRIATQQMEKQHIPAMTIAIVMDGRVVYSKGFGTADVENAVPATAETLIRTGSIAKPITAA